VNGAAAWAFVTEHTWWFGFGVAGIAMFGFPGLDLASFNLLLGLTAARGSRRQNSAYIAVNSVAIAVAGIASGAFGAYIAGRLSGWQGSILGWPLTYHGLLFLISALFRALSLVFAWRIEDQGAFPTRRALRYVGGNLYSNLQQALFPSARRFGRLTRRVFRFDRL